MNKLILVAIGIFSLGGPARAEQNDLVRDADGFYTFEHHPVANGWLATVTNGYREGQFTATFQDEKYYDLFQAFSAAGIKKVRCKEARGVWPQGFFIAHILSMSDCQF